MDTTIFEVGQTEQEVHDDRVWDVFAQVASGDSQMITQSLQWAAMHNMHHVIKAVGANRVDQDVLCSAMLVALEYEHFESVRALLPHLSHNSVERMVIQSHEQKMTNGHQYLCSLIDKRVLEMIFDPEQTSHGNTLKKM